MVDTAERMLVCRVGRERFGLPVRAVREVVSALPCTRIPGVSPLVRGLANVRGAIVTALSGPGLLGYPVGAPAAWLVVLTARDGRVGIEVDEVEDLYAAGDSVDVPLLELDGLLEPLIGPEPDRSGT